LASIRLQTLPQWIAWKIGFGNSKSLLFCINLF